MAMPTELDSAHADALFEMLNDMLAYIRPANVQRLRTTTTATTTSSTPNDHIARRCPVESDAAGAVGLASCHELPRQFFSRLLGCMTPGDAAACLLLPYSVAGVDTGRCGSMLLLLCPVAGEDTGRCCSMFVIAAPCRWRGHRLMLQHVCYCCWLAVFLRSRCIHRKDCKQVKQ